MSKSSYEFMPGDCNGNRPIWPKVFTVTGLHMFNIEGHHITAVTCPDFKNGKCTNPNSQRENCILRAVEKEIIDNTRRKYGC